MRKVVVVVALLLLATAAHAQKAGTVDVSAFVTDPSIWWTESQGTRSHAAYGVSANYFFSPRWSALLAVSSDTRTYTVFTPSDFVYRRDRVFPIDALTQYHFTNDTRWQPYIGAGINYVDRPVGYRHWLAPEANGGVTFAVTPHFGLNADFKLILPPIDANDGPQHRTSFGLTWRF